MNALKNPSFLRPLSRPSSPAPSRPDSGVGFERSLNKLSLGNFRRPSPAPAHLPPSTLIQDGSYLEMLSLKLSEAVSKTLTPPITGAPSDLINGKPPLPPGRGHSLGALISSELTAAKENSHLHRAILRSLHRPLSVLIDNLSTHLFPLLSSSAFPVNPTVQNPNINPTQVHALSLAAVAGEVLETFDEYALGLDGDVRGDGLRSIREGLLSIVRRTANPLFNGIKHELVNLMDALENSDAAKTIVVGKYTVTQHVSVTALQVMIPIYARTLSRYGTLYRSHTLLASLLISVIWHALLALSNRPYIPISQPPFHLTVDKKRNSPGSTPPLTPPSSRFTIKLPSPTSRPPSPPGFPAIMSSPASDSRTVFDLISMLPLPRDDQEDARLARGAVEEALLALKGLSPFLDHIHTVPASSLASEGNVQAIVDEIANLTADLPTLIALTPLLRAYSATPCAVSQMLGIDEETYRSTCLSGFGRADECATVVAHKLLQDTQPQCFDNCGIIGRWLQKEIALADEV